MVTAQIVWVGFAVGSRGKGREGDAGLSLSMRREARDVGRTDMKRRVRGLCVDARIVSCLTFSIAEPTSQPHDCLPYNHSTCKAARFFRTYLLVPWFSHHPESVMVVFQLEVLLPSQCIPDKSTPTSYTCSNGCTACLDCEM